mgnify:CR=1 FL=1
MSFIKQFTDNLLSMEFRTINNMNDNTILSDESKYMGLCKFTGNTMYMVVAINGDNPDYEIITHGLQNFLAMEKRFNVVSLFVYFKEKVDEKIINYCNVDILDYNAPYVELKWVVDISEKKIIVNGQQPNKLIDIEKAINSALNMEGYDVATDVRDLEKKHIENRAKNVKTNNKPSIAVDSELYITQGDKYDNTMLKATAYDKEDGDLTDKIVYFGDTVNTNVAGTYKVKF